MIRVLFSVFLIYHLFAIFTMPMISSILGRRLGKYITPYTNTIGLNPSWEFFSPDPPAPLYFEYTLYFENDNGDEVSPSIEGVFPEGGLEFTNNPNKIRLKTSVRLLAMSQGKADSIFISYLCRQYPKATRVYLKPIIELLPPIEKVEASDWEVNVGSMVTGPLERRCDELRGDQRTESESASQKQEPPESNNKAVSNTQENQALNNTKGNH